jgi:2-oxoglutarate dehydrogenase E2 component (dihydrolipoamide succinyltransferase)
MQVKVIMPQMGESVTQGTILKWTKMVGEKVEKDETLFEISTDKVDTEVPSPASGILRKILVKETETVAVKTVVAIIDTDVAAATRSPEKDVAVADLLKEHRPPEQPVETIAVEKAREPAASATITEQEVDGRRFYSPLVKSIARAEGIKDEELDRIKGSGGRGRVTKDDVLAYLRSGRKKPAPVDSPTIAPRSLATGHIIPSAGVEIIQMDNMRQRIAEHMVRSVHTSPHVMSASECDMTRIVNFRNKHKDSFERREGFKLTYTPFIVEASVKAIKDFPLVNSSIDGTKIIVKKYINVGVAVALESGGLIVPVIKNADTKNLVGLAHAVNDLATRARRKKLFPEDVQDGTFSITNPGIFGNSFGTPIINQPQVAILGVGAIKKHPVVLENEEGDAIAIRSMVYLTLSYDHRLVDGAMGGMFLQKVVDYLENFDTNSAI